MRYNYFQFHETKTMTKRKKNIRQKTTEKSKRGVVGNGKMAGFGDMQHGIGRSGGKAIWE